MKLKYNAGLPHQLDGIQAVVDLFAGQETCLTSFTVARAGTRPQADLFEAEEGIGVGNRLRLLEDELLANLQRVQLRNGLAPSKSLGALDFTVEMETGTGKTYVYLRTLFELNRAYGFTKFIIVVPSIAIKEGVLATLKSTREHFQGLYDKAIYDAFVFDSQNRSQASNFASATTIQIMVINIDAFRRSFDDPEKEDKANIIHRRAEQTAGYKPIELFSATRPIVIIDEPQSVDTTAKSSEAIASLNPLFTVRYSATHRNKHHPIYRLDAVDAYFKELVKRIEVAGVVADGGHNRAYAKLLRVESTKGTVTATVELDVLDAKTGQIRRTTKKKVGLGAKFEALSGGRGVYEGFTVEDISAVKGAEMMRFTGTDTVLRLGQAIGDVDDDARKRVQIRRTIMAHMKKERELRSRGLKVLSLFFIDRVANYRDYDAGGNPCPGKYAMWFEEEYARALRAENATLSIAQAAATAAAAHNGYFAEDKKRKDSTGRHRLTESKSGGAAAADESAYALIMQQKEKLLSLDEPLKFIFSHSALREGWDNPNVFQICTLNETASTVKKRQEIGRGLRIAVNQDGERVEDRALNTLTVVANESYDEFARKLQEEIEEDTGIRFGFVERHMFAPIPELGQDGTARELGLAASEAIWRHLRDQGYIDELGKALPTLRRDLDAGTLDLPELAPKTAATVLTMLGKVASKLVPADADAARIKMKLNKHLYEGEAFLALWERIKHKTTYRVAFDSEALINACAKEIAESPKVAKARFVVTTSALDINRGGVVPTGVASPSTPYDDQSRDFPIPDVVTFLQDATMLTRRSIVEVLRRSGRINDLKVNPQRFIEQAVAIIKQQKSLFIVDGIRYERIGDACYYVQELFEGDELLELLAERMMPVQNSVHEHVYFDSKIEEELAQKLDAAEDVKVFAKLPRKFKIDTPLGDYNPDWAVLVERDGKQRLYFVLESKSTKLTGDLRPAEVAKLKCGKAHFAAIDADVAFEKIRNFSDFQDLLG